jgi:hypothetical protein
MRNELGSKHRSKQVSEKEEGPSTPAVAVGVAAASGAALIATGILGAAPVAIAGVAGYIAYKGLKGSTEKKKAS